MSDGGNSFNKSGKNYGYRNIASKGNDNVGVNLVNKLEGFKEGGNYFGNISDSWQKILAVEFA